METAFSKYMSRDYLRDPNDPNKYLMTQPMVAQEQPDLASSVASPVGKAGLMAAGTALGGPVGLIGSAAVGGIGDYLVSQAKAEREKKIKEQEQAFELQKLQQQQQEQARLKGLETQGEAMYRGGMASQNALAQLMGNYGKAFL